MVIISRNANASNLNIACRLKHNFDSNDSITYFGRTRRKTITLTLVQFLNEMEG